MFINIKRYFKRYNQDVSDSGFSLLELVVAVGILLVLTVGGLLAYNGITRNARVAAVQSAASEVYTGAVAYDSNGQDYKLAEGEWNGSSKKKDGEASVVVSSDKPGGEDSGICVSAVMTEYPDIRVNRGAGCSNEGAIPPNEDDDSGEEQPPVSVGNDNIDIGFTQMFGGVRYEGYHEWNVVILDDKNNVVLESNGITNEDEFYESISYRNVSAENWVSESLSYTMITTVDGVVVSEDIFTDITIGSRENSGYGSMLVDSWTW